MWRAEDLKDASAVALKVLNVNDGTLIERFLLEAKTLASLDHPAIVQYVAHGQMEDGLPFLAMRWLTGSDLSARLRRGALSTQETLTIVRRVAAGLAVAHAQNVIHRDLKPANIVLINDDPAQATLVDFGVARPKGLTRGLTRTGAIVGTVGYMAAEQLQGSKAIDGRADLFALGCVAFECITGTVAYGGDNIAAVLAQVLLGQTPQVLDLLPSVAPELNAFVAKLMHSDREHRYASAAEVMDAIDRLETAVDAVSPTIASATATRLTLQSERSPVAVVLAWAPRSTDPSGETLAAHSVEQPTLHGAQVAERWAASLTRLTDGAMLLAFSEGHALHEKVARGARAALDLHALLPEWRFALTLSHAESSTNGPNIATNSPASSLSRDVVDSSHLHLGVTVDNAAEALLGSEFLLERVQIDAVTLVRLTGYVPLRDESRKVLGRESACIGREKDLRLIEGTLDEVIDECSARGVLLVAPPGVGKSRIRREIVGRFAERSDVQVLLAKTDVGTRLDHFSVIRQWLLKCHSVGVNGTPSQRWESFRDGAIAVLAQKLGDDRAQCETVAAFLGELAGVPAVPANTAVKDAQEVPHEIWSKLSSALTTWLHGLCKQRAVTLVIEDLHWADSMSMALLQSAWEGLGDAQLFWFVTSWPEGETHFPWVFSAKNVQVVRLEPLGKRASERIVRQLLGPSCDDHTIGQVVDLAGGNAFLLEEIVRHVGVDRELSALPTSAIALVQMRLQLLPMHLRKLLRLASAVGESFTISPLVALQQAGDSAMDVASIESALSVLRSHELLTLENDTWSFRHSLIRLAAYETLTEADRVNAHLALAQWMIRLPLAPSAMIAAQYEKAGAINDAAHWYLKAIEDCVNIGNFAAIEQFADRCDRDGVAADTRAEALFEKFFARTFGFDRVSIEELLAPLARPDMVEPSLGWYLLSSLKLIFQVHTGTATASAEAELKALLAAPVTLRATNAHFTTFSLLLMVAISLGLYSEVYAAAEAFEKFELRDNSRPILACTRDTYISFVYFMNDDARALSLARRAVALARASCTPKRQLHFFAHLIIEAVEFGAFEEAEATLQLAKSIVSPDDHFWFEWVLASEAKLSAYGPSPHDCRALAELGQHLNEMLHVRLWLRAFSVASAGFANPTDHTFLLHAISELEQIMQQSAQLAQVRETARGLVIELRSLLGQHELVLEQSEPLVATSAYSPVGMRTRIELCRLRALKSLGRVGECQQALGLAKSRIAMLAGALDVQDRGNFLAQPCVRDTLDFVL